MYSITVAHTAEEAEELAKKADVLADNAMTQVEESMDTVMVGRCRLIL